MVRGLLRRLKNAALALRGGYDVAKSKVSLHKLHSLLTRKSADSINSSQAGRVGDVARHLYRNHPVVKSVVRHLAQRVIGKAGIRPQFIDDDLDEAFKDWEYSAGLRGDSYKEVLRTAVCDFVTTGNGYIYWSEVDGKFQIDNFEQEELFHGVGSGAVTNNISNGIEFDEYGRKVAYHVEISPPAGILFSTEVQRIPARRVAHLWRRDRASQYRGDSDVACGSVMAFDMQDAMLAELNGLKLQGWYGLHRKADPNGGESGDQSLSLGAEELPADEKPETASGIRGSVEHEISFQGSEVIDFDGDVSLLSSNRPGGQFLPFMSVLMNLWSVSMGASPHIASGDYSKANYSSLKASENASKPTHEDNQQLTIEKLCRKIVKGWVEWVFVTGMVASRGRTVEQVMREVTWQTPGIPYVDPLKEVQSDNERVSAGVLTFDQRCAERGIDGRDQRKAIAAQKKLDEQYGIDTPSIGSSDKGTVTAPADIVEVDTENTAEVAT